MYDRKAPRKKDEDKFIVDIPGKISVREKKMLEKKVKKSKLSYGRFISRELDLSTDKL